MAARRHPSLRRCGKLAWGAAAVALLLFFAPAASSLPADTTPPSISYVIDGTPGTNNWYRGSTHGNLVVVKWTVTDPDSTVISSSGCEAAISIPGPNMGTTRTCSATSDGGTTAVTTKMLKIDADPPTGVAATAGRAADRNGWYNHSVGLSWRGSDATSGIASCTSSTYAGPDNAAAAPTGTCTDNAGNTSAAVALPLQYDATAPVFAPVPARSSNGNGWYKDPITISWHGSDATSGATCLTSTTYSGPDSGSADPGTSCMDAAGNTGSVDFPLKYDATAPNVPTATPARQANANGWYKDPVTVNWSGSDATSGPVSCSSLSYSGPDSATGHLTGSCTDKAGNSTSLDYSLKYDATAPTNVAATPGRAPDRNGWYNAPVAVSWGGTDATSTIASCTSLTYSSDAVSASVPGTCTDKAGNTSAPVSLGLKYDGTAPTVTPSAGRAPDSNGWYNHAVDVGWTAADPTSGVANCSPGVTYGGPDGASATTPSGSCTDNAGNSASKALTLKYDATAPAVTAAAGRNPDSNGWYNHPVAVGWSATDATSLVASCSATVTYNGPDGANATTPSGSCTDKAGNQSAPTPFALQYDASPPTNVTVSAARAPDHDGWYNHAVSIQWAADDATSGKGACTSTSFTGPDGAADAPSGSCTDKAGNTSAAVTFPLQFDGTPPTVTGTPVRPPDAGGWYNHAFAIGWSGRDATSGLVGCAGPGQYAGGDTDAAVASATCSDKAGNVGGGAIGFKYDATPPAVTAHPSRGPDHGAWYNRPVTVGFSGSDPVSGVASCTSVTYAGPFIKSDVPAGNCSDRAGNVGYASFPLDYDDTAPTLAGVVVASGESADVLHWRSSDQGSDQITITRTPRGSRAGAVVFRGNATRFADVGVAPSREYRYVVQAADAAGNSSRAVSVLALPKVLTFARVGYVPRVSGTPILSFPRVKDARFYHVQLFREGKRVLGIWPQRPRLALAAAWNWGGKRQHLRAGHYRWYAWAWVGRGKTGGYRLLGWADFIETG